VTCQVCKQEFEAVRSTAKFCSESCKQKAKRQLRDTLKRHAKNDTLRPKSDTLSDQLREHGDTVTFHKEKPEVVQKLVENEPVAEFKRPTVGSKEQKLPGLHKLCPTHMVPMTTFGKCLQKGCKFA
jgi:hypothetical protein